MRITQTAINEAKFNGGKATGNVHLMKHQESTDLVVNDLIALHQYQWLSEFGDTIIRGKYNISVHHMNSLHCAVRIGWIMRLQFG